MAQNKAYRKPRRAAPKGHARDCDFGVKCRIAPSRADAIWDAHERAHNMDEVAELLDRLENGQFVSPRAVETVQVKLHQMVARFKAFGNHEELVAQLERVVEIMTQRVVNNFMKDSDDRMYILAMLRDALIDDGTSPVPTVQKCQRSNQNRNSEDFTDDWDDWD
jgi:hypothetical protein